MTRNVIADNWAFQDIADLLSQGYSESNADMIHISTDTHSYKPMRMGIVQTEALFDLLTEIVLRDEIIVDAAFSHTWDQVTSPLQELSRCGFFRKISFLETEGDFSEIREHLAERLCVTESLQREHEVNVREWISTKSTPNPFLSAVLWGGAGMAARSSVYRSSYCPHPIRRKLFESAGFSLSGLNAHEKANSIINEKRFQVVNRLSANDSLYSMNVVLPPIPVRIIEQCSTPSDLIDVAIQIRTEFQQLRDWLKEAERLILLDDIHAVQKQYELLQDVSSHIDQIMGISTGDTTLSVSIGVLKMSWKIDPMRQLRNQFGVRSVMNKMILGPSGQSALARYCSIFGISGTSDERLLQDHFSSQ